MSIDICVVFVQCDAINNEFFGRSTFTRIEQNECMLE